MAKKIESEEIEIVDVELEQNGKTIVVQMEKSFAEMMKKKHPAYTNAKISPVSKKKKTGKEADQLPETEEEKELETETQTD